MSKKIKYTIGMLPENIRKHIVQVTDCVAVVEMNKFDTYSEDFINV